MTWNDYPTPEHRPNVPYVSAPSVNQFLRSISYGHGKPIKGVRAVDFRSPCGHRYGNRKHDNNVAYVSSPSVNGYLKSISYGHGKAFNPTKAERLWLATLRAEQEAKSGAVSA